MSIFSDWRKKELKENPVILAKKRHDKAIEGLITTPELDLKIKNLRDQFENDKKALREDFNNRLQILIVESMDKEIELINQEKGLIEENSQKLSV